MRIFYRVQWKRPGSRTWVGTSWGADHTGDPHDIRPELSYKQAADGKQRALKFHGINYGKFRILKITQTTEVVH